MNNGWYPTYEQDRGRMGYGQEPYWNGQRNQQPTMPQPQPAQPIGLYDVINMRTRVDWVQGEYAFKSYGVQPGTSVILFDLENPNRVYVKAVNAAGMPIYAAGFDLSEARLGQPAASPDDDRYVPRAEFERSMNQIAKLFAELTANEKKGEEHERQSTETARMGYESDRHTAAESERGEPGAGFPGI